MERDLRLDWQALVREARRRRKEQGLTQRRLAAIAGLTQPTVSRFEQGETRIQLETAIAVLEVLGLVTKGSSAREEDRFEEELHDFSEAMKEHPGAEILEGPHLFAQVCPVPYRSGRVAAFEDLERVLAASRSRVRSRELPAGLKAAGRRERGSSWLGCREDRRRRERWRFYESGHFVLFSELEGTRGEARRSALEQTRKQLAWNPHVDWMRIPGVICAVELVDRLTLLHRFSAHLATELDGTEAVHVRVGLRRVEGYLGGFLAYPDREIDTLMQATSDVLEKTWRYSARTLEAEAEALAREVTEWFLRRLGWNRGVAEWIEREQT